MSSIVLGSTFGDEGKGLTTSFLCSKEINPIVVRFNGGHQAGHTVIHRNFRHVFSNFGSGTLQNVPTYWSEYCTFYPISICNEYAHLVTNGYMPNIFVHPLCPVTTPFDALINKSLERKNKHGSCGVGFGQTIQRQENYYKLFVQDLFYDQILLAKLKNISKYYEIPFSSEMIEPFLMAVKNIREFIKVAKFDEIFRNYNLVFEGAQGMLLDQDFGFFPNVTRSNTTSKNALEIGGYNHDIYYITRTYQTRHGNGFMTNENLDCLELVNNENETNKDNEWQGNFRTAVLDVDLLNYAYECDNHFSKGLKKNLVITCVDQTGEDFFVTVNKKLKQINVNELSSLIKVDFKNVYISRGPSLTDIEKNENIIFNSVSNS